MPRARHTWMLAALVAVVTITVPLGTSRGQSGYSNYSLRGVYRATYSGINLPDGLPESGISIVVADGLGNITGTKVLNFPDVFCSDVKQTGTYTVDANGFGRLSTEYTSPTPGCSGSYTSSFLLHEDGKLVTGVSNSTSFIVLSEIWRRD